MPRGMPRTKRTAKPGRHEADLMQYYRRGDLEVLDVGERWVKLVHHLGKMTVIMSREQWERKVGELSASNLLIRVSRDG